MLIGLALLMVLALALRLHGLNDWPLWDDELAQWTAVVNAGPTDYLFWRHHSFHAPLSYAINDLVCALTGSDAAWVWRLPSVMFGVLCVPAAYYAGLRIRSTWLGLAVAALVAVDPNNIHVSQYARMYTHLTFVTLLSIGVLADHAKRPNRPVWSWALLGLLLGAAMWIHLYASVLWFGVGVGALFYLLTGRLPSEEPFNARGVLRGLCIAMAVAALVGAPGLFRVVQSVTADSPVGGKAGVANLSEAVRVIRWSTGLLYWLKVPMLTPAVLLLSLLGSGLLFRWSRLGSCVLAALAIGTAIMSVKTLMAHPILPPRYLVVLQPTLWLGLAGVLVALSRTPIRHVGLILFVLLVVRQAWFSTRLDDSYQLIDNAPRSARAFAAAVEFVADNRQADEAVGYLPRARFAPRSFYYGLPAHPVLEWEGFAQERRTGRWAPDVEHDLAKRLSRGFNPPGLWLVVWTRSGQIAPADLHEARLLVQALGAEFESFSYDHILRSEPLFLVAHVKDREVRWHGFGIGHAGED